MKTRIVREDAATYRAGNDGLFDEFEIEPPPWATEEAQPPVKDLRGHRFFIIDDAIIDAYGELIGPYGLALYAALCRHCNKQGKCWPSWPTLAQETGMSERKARYAAMSLREHGLLEIEHREAPDGRKMSNLFVLLPVKGRG